MNLSDRIRNAALYGPSRLDGTCIFDWFHNLTNRQFDRIRPLWDYSDRPDEITGRMFLLFVAEALADQATG